MDGLTSLLLAARDGDRAALERFVTASQAEVWRLVAHLVDPGVADDLTQEVYLRALRAAPRFRGDASARTWLLTIARRTAADEIRRRQRVRRTSEAVPDPEPEPDPTGAVALTELVAQLDPDRRTAFVLTQLLGLPYAEAAAISEVPVGTIRSRVSRARQDLVAMLAAPGDTDAATDGDIGTGRSTATDGDGDTTPHHVGPTDGDTTPRRVDPADAPGDAHGPRRAHGS